MKKISFNFFHYNFSFSRFSIVFFLIIFGFLLLLGIWQLHRAEEKKQWLLQRQPIMAKPILLTENISVLPNFALVKVEGHYLNKPVIFLDNKIYNHQVGYEVLIPFVLEGSRQNLWVNRGWIPRGSSRNHLPNIIIPSGKFLLTGYVHFPDKSFLAINKHLEKMGEYRFRIPTFQTDIMSKLSKESFYPFELWLISDHAGDELRWVRDWSPKAVVTPERHFGYAVQWFGLAIAFLVVFVALHRKHTV